MLSSSANYVLSKSIFGTNVTVPLNYCILNGPSQLEGAGNDAQKLNGQSYFYKTCKRIEKMLAENSPDNRKRVHFSFHPTTVCDDVWYRRCLTRGIQQIVKGRKTKLLYTLCLWQTKGSNNEGRHKGSPGPFQLTTKAIVLGVNRVISNVTLHPVVQNFINNTYSVWNRGVDETQLLKQNSTEASYFFLAYCSNGFAAPFPPYWYPPPDFPPQSPTPSVPPTMTSYFRRNCSNTEQRKRGIAFRISIHNIHPWEFTPSISK